MSVYRYVVVNLMNLANHKLLLIMEKINNWWTNNTRILVLNNILKLFIQLNVETLHISKMDEILIIIG